MARFQDDSSDDEIGVNLQLAERLRINRVEQVSPSACDKKSLKNWYNQNRRRHMYDFFSSSSSSIDMSYDSSLPVEPSCSYSNHNKKRQNGDKSVEQLYNPKRTCLSKGSRHSPIKQKRRCEISDVNQLNALPSTSVVKSLLPDKIYEDHMNNDVTDDDDSDFEPRKITRKKVSNHGASDNSRGFSKNCPEVHKGHSHNKAFQFMDSTSEDDSKNVLQNGALKGGRQSPDTVVHKKVPVRKMKKLLDSDSDEDWQVGYRSRPLIFSSESDSEPAHNVSNSSSANLAFSSGDVNNSCPNQSYYQPDAGLHGNLINTSPNSNYNPQLPSSPLYGTKCPYQSHIVTPQPTVQITPINNISISLHPGSDMTYPDMPSTSRGSSQCRPVCNRYPVGPKSSKYRNVSSYNPTHSYEQNLRPRFSREAGVFNHNVCPNNMNMSYDEQNFPGAVYPRNQYIDPRTLVPPNRIACSPPQRIPCPPPLRIIPPSQYRGISRFPDIFDDESSEVEFFTANSYSDTESNEPVPGCPLNPHATEQSSHPVPPSQDPINVASSEDEISVVYTKTIPRSNDEPRGSARTFGRRYSRHQHVRLPSPLDVVSLSPDPVEQVRQVEEDERFAKMLQAQFDAEIDPTYSPCLETPSTSEQRGSTDSTSSEDSNESLFSVNPPFTSSVPALGTHGLRYHIPPLLQAWNFRFGTGRHTNGLNLTVRPTTRRPPYSRRRPIRRENLLDWDLPMEFRDTYESLLGLDDMYADEPRGLQRSEISRLPTRRYAAPSAAGSSGGAEPTHRRSELNKECQVCLNDYVDGDVLRILPCFHEFHTPCIDPWLKINHTCPVCRVVVDLQQ